MPHIISSEDLRLDYDAISVFCHQYAEPVFVTQNGQCDLAVLSLEFYEQLIGKLELYGLLQHGMNDVKFNRTRPADEVMSDLRKLRNKRNEE